MLEFNSCNELVEKSKMLVKSHGRVYVSSGASGLQDRKICQEILGFNCSLLDWPDRGMVREKLGDENYRFLEVELEEWLNPHAKNPGEAWKQDPKTWSSFLKENGTFQYTYNQRFFLKEQAAAGELSDSRGSQIDNVINTLVKDPYSRQAFIGIWNPYQDSNQAGKRGPEGRVPCTIGYQFFLRPKTSLAGVDTSENLDLQLEMVYMMRSLNASWNLWNDLFLVTGLFNYIEGRLRKQFAGNVGLKNYKFSPVHGPIYIQANSLHVFI